MHHQTEFYRLPGVIRHELLSVWNLIDPRSSHERNFLLFRGRAGRVSSPSRRVIMAVSAPRSETSAEREAKKTERSASQARRPDGWRETVESVVVAFVLAFLFRTFEAEAFVIPTGSMAPTLYGQHRDIHCQQCGTRFAVGASSGNAPDAEIRNGNIEPRDRSHYATCPNANCRFPNDVLDREMFAGDRILVNKFPYEFGEPERFDVVVFKFPEGAKTNYIKRLVALPGEEARLEGGDVKVRKLGSNDNFMIARKTPEKQRLLQLLVHDNDAPARDLLKAGWPEAWSPLAGSSWAEDSQARAFRVDPDPRNPDTIQWLRYTNYAPTAGDWNNVLAGGRILTPPQPQEVRDFYAYNAKISAGEAALAVGRGKLPDPSYRDNGVTWVGDLTLTCSVELLEARGEVVFELIEGSRRYLTTGRGQLEYRKDNSSDDEPLDTAGDPFQTGMKSAGTYEVSFANVDDRLCVWIDGSLVYEISFDPGSRYEPPRQPVSPGERDKSPVAIGARDAKLRVSHLKIERDIFYLNEGSGGRADRSDTFELIDSSDDAQDQFLMLGDNSPRSNDSRLWTMSHAVPRRLLIGKAFFIYWPHGIPFLNGGRGFALGKYEESRPKGAKSGVPLPRMSIPFYPQFGRMHRIR
jgi:signal peptidase I